MLTLINDDFDYANLISEECRKASVNLKYFEKEYDAAKYEEACKNALKNDSYVCDNSLDIDAKSVLTYLKDIEIKNDFAGFNAAIYSGFKTEEFREIFVKTTAKEIKFESSCYENGARFLELNKEMAYKKAAKIVLDAYDSGADFLLVGDSLSFYMFDTMSANLARVSNRDFKDFYILHFAEFLALANDKNPKTLKNHKLKVSLV